MAGGRPSKKRVIVAAAGALFTQNGYQGTSIDQVVVAAGVSKPTVYNNFPTKLVLWENVLQTLTEQAQNQLEKQLLVLMSANNKDFLDGWISLWLIWINAPERLVAYQIMLGEQHKMLVSTFDLFKRFEDTLEKALTGWLHENSVPQEKEFTLQAITREALLTPSLMNRARVNEEALKKILAPQLGL
jgi:AcrR family transcriptional regulator